MNEFVLENKLEISDEFELYIQEEKITKLKAINLKNMIHDINNLNTVDGLCFIHKYLFEDVYGWAGTYRTMNISKDNFKFCLVRHFAPMLDIIRAMPENCELDIVRKYIEINLLHPFRDGNGRSARLWLDFNLEVKFNTAINWHNISVDEYLNAMKTSSVDESKIINLILNNLSHDCSMESFFKRLDMSYRYEQMDEYTCEVLYEFC